MNIHSNRELALRMMRPENIDCKTVFAGPAITTDLQQLLSRASIKSVPGFFTFETDRITLLQSGQRPKCDPIPQPRQQDEIAVLPPEVKHTGFHERHQLGFSVCFALLLQPQFLVLS